jgi:hypothetical protein
MDPLETTKLTAWLMSALEDYASQPGTTIIYYLLIAKGARVSNSTESVSVHIGHLTRLTLQ